VNYLTGKFIAVYRDITKQIFTDISLGKHWKIMPRSCVMLLWAEELRSIIFQCWPRHQSVPECFKDDNASQCKSGEFDPRSLKNPWTDRHLNLYEWLCRGPLPLCKISSRYGYPFLPPNMRKYASSDSASFFGAYRRLQPRPLHRFSRSVGYVKWRVWFRARMCLFGVPKQNFTFRPHSPQNANFSPIFDET